MNTLVFGSILITGGSGSFGTAMAKWLLDTGYYERIIIFSRGEHRQAEMCKKFNSDRLRFFIGDVRDRDRLRRAMNRVDDVIHAAALKRIEVGFYNPIEMVKTNVDGAINVIEAAQDAGVHRVVALSSDKAFEPISPYGATKALAESLFMAANNITGPGGPRFALCRYGNVWNSAGSVVPAWRNILLNNDTVPVTDPDCTRFFMRMGEAITLVKQTLLIMKGGEIKIPTLPAFRLGDLAEAMGAKMEVKGLPTWEKKHESMESGNSSDKAVRMTVEELKQELERTPC